MRHHAFAFSNLCNLRNLWINPSPIPISVHGIPIDFGEAVIERSAFTSFMTSSAEV
jgi:hypothetical protein